MFIAGRDGAVAVLDFRKILSSMTGLVDRAPCVLGRRNCCSSLSFLFLPVPMTFAVIPSNLPVVVGWNCRNGAGDAAEARTEGCQSYCNGRRAV